MVSPTVSTSPVNSSKSRAGKHIQRGFGLIEMAVVLFLLSLLLAGTLRGNELINTGHINGLADNFRTIPPLINTYRDKYRSAPGDDLRAEAHLGAIALSGNGNGVIDGNWYDIGIASEASRLWQHLRLAGLMGGAVNVSATDYTPQNALGHPLGVQGGTGDPGRSPITNLQGLALSGTFVVCSRGVPGNLVQPLDIRLDDGNPATGRMLATPDTGAAYALGAAAATLGTDAATDLQFGKSYIVCMGS